MIKNKNLEIISCGPGLSEINKIHGRSCDWTYGIVKNKISKIKIVNVYENNLPSISRDSVWIILGSRYSVYDEIEWIDLFEKHIRKGIENRVPMLGICFGHQIIGSAIGASVVNNSEGWEVGSSKVSLTETGRKSPLFKGFEDSFLVYESHHDTVVDLPDKVELLAQNEYGLQSFSYEDFIFGVQFHPEFSFEVMKAYYSARIKKIDNNKKYYVNNLNQGLKVIDNFINIIKENKYNE